MRFVSLALLLLTSCAGSPFNRAPSSKDLPWGLSSGDLPDPNAIVRWSNPHYEESRANLDDLPQVESQCADKKLYPSHPQQNSKTYHVFRTAIYDNQSVPADSRTCKISSRGAKKVCLLTDVYNYSVISDLFLDSCGTLYRGFWRVGFLKQDDNLGMLLSKGRTVYPRQNAEYSGETELGPTYSVDRKDFLFLTGPFPGDEETVAKLSAEANPMYSFDSATHLFQKKSLLKAAKPSKSEPFALEPVLAE